LFGLALLFWPVRPLRSDNFVFYMPNARLLVPTEIIQNSKYLPLLQVLNLLGKVSGLQEKRNTLKVWFGNTQLELRQDQQTLRVDKLSLNLAEPVRVSNGQWMVPVDFLTSVLPRLTHQVVEYQVGTNRIFIGDVKPCAFTVRLNEVGNGARLTVQFTDKVTVKTASINGKWVMFLGDRPVEPLEPAYHFQNPYLTELRFDDEDGSPKLILSPAMEGLNFYPVLAEGGKVLLADVLKPPPAVAQQLPPPTGQAAPGQAPPAGTQAPAGITEEAPAAPPGPPLPVVVLDAGHGGEETGGRSRDGVLEKDLVAQLVARVRLALLSTQRFRIVLTRTGDVNPSFEERTMATNVAGAVAFVTFHAGDLGAASPRIAVYAYQPSSPPAPVPGDEPRPIFLPWVTVQQAHLDQSRQLALALQEQFARLTDVTADGPQAAPIRTLRSVNAPAVAVEIGRLAPDIDAGPVVNPDFLQRLSEAVAKALVAFTGKGA
jgi:N-acetylmuramoyl-L-alanine amidase